MRKKSGEVGDIIDNLRRLVQAFNEVSKRAVHTTGLTGPQLWAIKTIAEESPVRVSDLARRMHLHPATVVGILDRLMLRGLVLRTRSTEDRRVVMVELTSAGEQIVRNAPRVPQGLLVVGLEKMPAGRRRTVATGLIELVNLLDGKQKPPELMLFPEAGRTAARRTVRERKR